MIKSEESAEAFDLQKFMLHSVDAMQNALRVPLSSAMPVSAEAAEVIRAEQQTAAGGDPALSGMPGDMAALFLNQQIFPPGMAAALLEQMHAAASLQQTPPVSATGPSPFGVFSSLSNSTTSKEAYCDLCDKSFCNRYFLRTHRLKKHGINEGSPTKAASPAADGAGPLDLHAPSTSLPVSSSVIVTGAEMKRELSPQAKKRRLDGKGEDAEEMSSLLGGGCHCDECGVECPSLLSLLAHKASHASLSSLNPLIKNEEEEIPLSCDECPVKAESSAALREHKTLSHFSSVSSAGDLQNVLQGLQVALNPYMLQPGMGSVFGLPPGEVDQGTASSTAAQKAAPKRTYSSGGKNYCNICNKEVCNKYFLRTHMFKMHNIVIDLNKSIIANIDTRERERTGELIFRCDICPAELKSRALLREHKSEQHGLNSSLTPSTPRSQKPSSSVTGSPPPQSFSLPLPLPPTLSSFTQPQETEPSVMPVTVSFSTPSTNAARCQEGEAEGVACATSAASSGTLPHSCPACGYRTRYARNMEHHVERHDRLNDAEGGGGEEEAMEMTTRAALQMVATTNQVKPTPAKTLSSKSQGGRRQCKKCGREYTSRFLLRIHKAKIHGPAELSALRASFCSKAPREVKISSARPLRLPNPSKKTTRFLLNDHEEAVAVENNSHTSGSLSPIPPDNVAPFSSSAALQTFKASVSCPWLPSCFSLHLPVLSLVHSPLQLTLHLTPSSDAHVIHT